MHAHVQCKYMYVIVVILSCVMTDIDVQLVGLIKTLIDPENIMTEPPAVVSHMTIT